MCHIRWRILISSTKSEKLLWAADDGVEQDALVLSGRRPVGTFPIPLSRARLWSLSSPCATAVRPSAKLLRSPGPAAALRRHIAATGATHVRHPRTRYNHESQQFATNGANARSLQTMWEQILVAVVAVICAAVGAWAALHARRSLPASPQIISVDVAIADMTSFDGDRVVLDVKVLNNGGSTAYLSALKLQISRLVNAPAWDPIAPSINWLALRGAVEPSAKYDLKLPAGQNTAGHVAQVAISHALKAGEGDRFVVAIGTQEHQPNRLVYVVDVSAVHGGDRVTIDGPKVGLGFGMAGDSTHFPVADTAKSSPRLNQHPGSLDLNQRAAARDVEADVALLLRDVPRVRAAIDTELAAANKPPIDWTNARTRTSATEDLVPWLTSRGIAEASSSVVWRSQDFVEEQLDAFETRCRTFLTAVDGAMLDPAVARHLQYIRTSLVGIEAARSLLDASPRSFAS